LRRCWVGAQPVRALTGRVYVVFWDPVLLDRATLDLEEVGFAIPGFLAYGDGPPPLEGIGDGAGTTLAAAGDVNGDGFADLLIGAPRVARLEGGVDYLLFGAPDYPPRVDLASLGTRGVVLRGPSSPVVPVHAGAVIGGEAAAGAGDVDGDGLADFLVGVGGNCCNFARPTVSGRAYLVSGRRSWPLELDLVAEAARGAPGVVTFRGAASGDHAGKAVESAGDVDCDEYMERTPVAHDRLTWRDDGKVLCRGNYHPSFRRDYQCSSPV
jgi:hypothetical protein